MILPNKRKFKNGDRVIYMGKHPATVTQCLALKIVKIEFDQPTSLDGHPPQTWTFTVEKYLTPEGPKGDPSWKDLWDSN